MPWPRIHCGSEVTSSPGVIMEFVFDERRGRLWGEGGVLVSGSEFEGEAEREGWGRVEGGTGDVIVKVMIGWTVKEWRGYACKGKMNELGFDIRV